MSENTVNVSGNEAGSVTEGLPETRSWLKKLAMAHGARSKIGHACYNLLEMTENWAKSRRLSQRKQLAMNMNREMARLQRIRITGE